MGRRVSKEIREEIISKVQAGDKVAELAGIVTRYLQK